MMLILFALIGAIFNRVRGGWILPSNGGAVNAVAFGVLAGALLGSYWAMLAAGVGMLVGQSFGWGRYIGAACGYEDKQLKEVWFIDALIAWLRPKPFATQRLNIHTNNPALWHYTYPTLKLRIWGIAGLSLRGIVWALCLGLSMAYWAPADLWWVLIFCGATMGVVYPVAREITLAMKTPNPNGDGWELGEFIFGAILWAGILINLIG